MKTVIKIAISLSAIVILISQMNFKATLASLKQLSPTVLLFAFLLIILGTIVKTWQWHLIIRRQAVAVSFIRLLKYNFIAFFYSQVIPSSLSGEIAKMAKMWHNVSYRKKIFSSILIDKMIFVLTLTAIAAIISIASGAKIPSAITRMVAILLIIFLVLWLFISPLKRMALWQKNRWSKAIHVALESFALLSVSTVLLCMALSTVFCAIGAVAYYIVAEAMSLNIPFLTLAFVFIISSAILMLPISIGGIGVKEYTFVLLLGEMAGTPLDAAVVLSLIVTVLKYLVALGSGILDLADTAGNG